MINEIIETFPEEDFITADGFNDAIIGVDLESNRIIYSVSKCIDILMNDMNRDEALEYFEFNIQGSYVGEKTPIWCTDNF